MEYLFGVFLGVFVWLMVRRSRRKRFDDVCRQYGWSSGRHAKEELRLRSTYPYMARQVRQRGPVSYVETRQRHLRMRWMR